MGPVLRTTSMLLGALVLVYLSQWVVDDAGIDTSPGPDTMLLGSTIPPTSPPTEEGAGPHAEREGPPQDGRGQGPESVPPPPPPPNRPPRSPAPGDEDYPQGCADAISGFHRAFREALGVSVREAWERQEGKEGVQCPERGAGDVCLERARSGSGGGGSEGEGGEGAPILESHSLPEWYSDAKLGLFIHFGIYSVPGWAVNKGVFGTKDFSSHKDMMTNMPYAEWYMNSLAIQGSPTQAHHQAIYGKKRYLDFIPSFNQALRSFDPNVWGDLASWTGARYTVLTTKHHDGFLLWNSSTRNPRRKSGQQHTERDIVGEAREALQGRSIPLGLYYSGGIDWSFHQDPLRPGLPPQKSYGAYADRHLRELVERYRPALLWNDIGYPLATSKLRSILADYYTTCPQGAINDRWYLPLHPNTTRGVKRMRRKGRAGTAGTWYDFTTPEYSLLKFQWLKWETCRGVGRSFGYNSNEAPENILTGREMVRTLVRVVASNGNLLLGFGPTANGSVPVAQQVPLRALGAWLGAFGASIFATLPVGSGPFPVFILDGVRSPWEQFRASLTQSKGGGIIYFILPGLPPSNGGRLHLQTGMVSQLRLTSSIATLLAPIPSQSAPKGGWDIGTVLLPLQPCPAPTLKSDRARVGKMGETICFVLPRPPPVPEGALVCRTPSPALYAPPAADTLANGASVIRFERAPLHT